MKFKDNFYSVLSTSSEGENHQFHIRIEAGHRIFDGHFPGNPVTPGVAQMEIVKELVGEVLAQPMRMQTMGNCKFLAILNPQTDAQVSVDLKIQEGEEIKVSATISNAANTYLKMSATYLPA